MTLKCKCTCEWYYGLYITWVKCAISLDFVVDTILPVSLLLILHSHSGCSHTHQYPVRGLRICSRHWLHRLEQITLKYQIETMRHEAAPFKHLTRMQSLSDFKVHWFLIRSGICPHAKKTTLVFAHQCFLSEDVFFSSKKKTTTKLTPCVHF